MTTTDPHTAAQVEDHVVLVDDRGRRIGEQSRLSVHGPDTPRHLAFSLYLFDGEQRLLMTRRALTKRTWPGVWTNTCCGHPRPGESPVDAVGRRLQDELGLGVDGLRCVLPQFSYRAQDASGIWENELCPVFVGRVVHPDGPFQPNHRETVETSWVEWQNMVRAVQSTPFAFSPWSVRQVGELAASGLFGENLS